MSDEKKAVTVEELDALCATLAQKEEQKENAEGIVKAINKEIATLEGRVTAYLKELGRTKYDSPHGKATIVEKWRVNMPADDLAKKEFFGFLKERGLFDKMATVNANSLNAYYMREMKEADDPMTFTMPGIGAPKVFESVQFKVAKK